MPKLLTLALRIACRSRCLLNGTAKAAERRCFIRLGQRRKASSLLLADNALVDSFNGLPSKLQHKMIDYMRLTPRKPGFDGAHERLCTFVDGLTDKEYKAYADWANGLSKQRRLAIVYGVGGGRW